MILGLMLAMLFQQAAAPLNPHEYSDLVQINASEILARHVSGRAVSEGQKLELKDLFRFRDFTGKALNGRQVNFHLPAEKGFKPAKVLIMTYVAEWCENCEYEVPYLKQLYKKYKSRGLEIVARSEYSEVKKLRALISHDKWPYPVLRGSEIAYDEREKIRMETFQYLLRSTLGDQRKWGIPFTIIVVHGELENPYVVAGEMKEDQVNDLIERSLATAPPRSTGSLPN